MRYHELTENRPSRRTIVGSRERLCLGPAVMRDAANTQSIPLVIRLLAAVYRELDLRIGHGGPDAMIDINDAWVRFPEPFDETGDISEGCRNWIIEAVRDATMRTNLSMCILFQSGPIYVWEGDLVIGGKPPEGGLRL